MADRKKTLGYVATWDGKPMAWQRAWEHAKGWAAVRAEPSQRRHRVSNSQRREVGHSAESPLLERWSHHALRHRAP